MKQWIAVALFWGVTLQSGWAAEGKEGLAGNVTQCQPVLEPEAPADQAKALAEKCEETLTEAANTPELLDCSKPENAELSKKVKDAFYKYRLATQKDEPATREVLRTELLTYVANADPKTCFTGRTDLLAVCAQIQTKHDIVQGNKMVIPVGQDGTIQLVREKLPNGSWDRVWHMVSTKKDQIGNGEIGTAADNNGDGFIDRIYLSGAWELEEKTVDKNVGFVTWKAKEKNFVKGEGHFIDLKKPPFSTQFQVMAREDKCLSEYGNPAVAMDHAAREKGWKADAAALTEKQAKSTLDRKELLKESFQGLSYGVYKTGKATADMFVGIKELVVNPEARKAVKAAVGALNEKALSVYEQCLVDNDLSMLLALKCVGLRMDAVQDKIYAEHIVRKYNECKFSGGDVAKFSQCMGEISTLVAESYLAGKAALKAAPLALNASRAVRVTGKSIVWTMEWLVDPIGFGTMGSNQFRRFKEALKQIQKEAKALAEKGLFKGLTEEQADQLRRYLLDYAKHIQNPKDNALPILSPAIESEIRAADPLAMEQWKGSIMAAREDKGFIYAVQDIIDEANALADGKLKRQLNTEEIKQITKHLGALARATANGTTREFVLSEDVQKKLTALDVNLLAKWETQIRAAVGDKAAVVAEKLAAGVAKDATDPAEFAGVTLGASDLKKMPDADAVWIKGADFNGPPDAFAKAAPENQIAGILEAVNPGMKVSVRKDLPIQTLADGTKVKPKFGVSEDGALLVLTPEYIEQLKRSSKEQLDELMEALRTCKIK